MTRHLLIALQPRRVEVPHLVGIESNHLGYDSTAHSRQGAVVATRYPLFIQRKVSPPPIIQIKKEGERRFLLLTVNTTKPAIVAQENYTLSATFSLLATFVLLLRQPLGGLPLWMVHIKSAATVESFSPTAMPDPIPGTWSPGDVHLHTSNEKSYCTSSPPCSLLAWL